MQVSVGTRLGPYEVVSRIGAGGMGEVWKGRDTRLERSVAIKILAAEFASNDSLKLRFEREARAISQLTHPHICTLYDIGESDFSYLVMEYLEGETLAERLAKGPLPLADVITYGAQIAEALDRAHRAAVIHRDLKPGNVMITKSGAKLLDFGLAKSGAISVSTDDATVQKALTQEGTILGTFQYMAPEQLEGMEADARTDIFALGCVLYEMATGRRAFQGKTKTSLIAQIVSGTPPPVSSIQPMTPPALDHVIKKCLSKEPDNRWQSAHDIAEELKWIGEAGSQAGIAAPLVSRRRLRERLALGSTAVALVAAVAVGFVLWKKISTAPSQPVMRFAVPLAADPRVPEAYGHLAISPDGTRIVYLGRDGEQSRLWLRPIGSLESKPIAGTEGARQPFFSPDGKWIAYFARHKLWKVPVAGGVPIAICSASYPRGGTWGDDGTIIFEPFFYSALQRVPADGGKPEYVTDVRRKEGERNHRWPHMLPGSKAFLYAVGLGGTWDEALIVAQRIPGGERKIIVRGGFGPRYVSTGHLVFMRKDSLYAIEFDPETLETNGEAVPVLQGIANNLAGNGEYTISDNGILAYLPSGATYDEGGKLRIVDRRGERLEIKVPENFRSVQFSPSGRVLAGGIGDEVWTYDLDRNASSRVTSAYRALSPTWTPDGKRLAFAYEKDGPWNPFSRSVDGSDLPQSLYTSDAPVSPLDWSPDGKRLLVTIGTVETSFDVALLDAESGKLSTLVQTENDETDPTFSPDGRWIAYVSDESGRFEVYVRNLEAGGRWQISNDGGSQPRWAGASELFYKSGRKLMKVDVKTEPSFSAASPTVLFEKSFSEYDVSPDGTRIAIVETSDSGPASDRFEIVINWFDELRARTAAPNS